MTVAKRCMFFFCLVADKAPRLTLAGPIYPAMGKEALPSHAVSYANGTQQVLVERKEDITMRDAVKFSNLQPRSFAQQLSTQGDKVRQSLTPPSVATKC